jgi:hypothetical protein
MIRTSSLHTGTRPTYPIITARSIRAVYPHLIACGLNPETLARRLRLRPEVNADSWLDAVDRACLHPTARRIADALLSAVASDGVVTATIGELAGLSGASRSSASRAVDALMRAGLITSRSHGRYALTIGGQP